MGRHLRGKLTWVPVAAREKIEKIAQHEAILTDGAETQVQEERAKRGGCEWFQMLHV